MRVVDAADRVQQQLHAALADLLEVLADGGERRRQVAREGDVVEPDEADVSRYLAARLEHGAHDAERHLVVGGEDRRHVAVLCQQAAELIARPHAPVAEPRRRNRDLGRLQHRAPALDAPSRRRPILGPGDVRHRPVAEIEQQARRRGRAGGLVDRDHGHHGLRRVPDRDQRYVHLLAVELARDPVLPGVEEDPVDALSLQLVERPEQRSAVERGEPGDAHGVSVRVGGALEPELHRGRPERDRVGADDPERLRPTGHQRLRGGVRAIVQPAHRREHPIARVPAHVAVRIDHARDGLLRDAGELGHVAHRCGPSPRSLRSARRGHCASMTHASVTPRATISDQIDASSETRIIVAFAASLMKSA